MSVFVMYIFWKCLKKSKLKKKKSDIKLEEYLKSERNFKNRQLLTKFGLSDHNLEIELGRCKNIPRNQIHCKFCRTLDDEFHFFFDCKVTDNIRPSFIDFMKRTYPYFNQLDSLEKLKIILNPDKKKSPSLCNFIKRSLEARIWGSRWSKHIKHNIVFIKQW